ncbi:hypothetical protein PCANC_27355 [Puccinia coronata f. sp. avenae]|uniref:Uncharacterized protein n=1 Tax=Puccinia coronata f. sp. avenae TaxID=200324 RepID=A0A2N5TIR8_9BASI|nr:hypothetical protein PCANC_27355 [Puccinia coronata f. sp. avenae]
MATPNAPGTSGHASSLQPEKEQKWHAVPLPGGQSTCPLPNADFLRMMLESQHNGILLAQQERAALAESSAEQIARLEDAILLLSAQLSEPPRDTSTPTAGPGRIDLYKFCIANGPTYNGLFHAVKPFLK